jgi:hypothetical protein
VASRVLGARHMKNLMCSIMIATAASACGTTEDKGSCTTNEVCVDDTLRAECAAANPRNEFSTRSCSARGFVDCDLGGIKMRSCPVREAGAAATSGPAARGGACVATAKPGASIKEGGQSTFCLVGQTAEACERPSARMTYVFQTAATCESLGYTQRCTGGGMSEKSSRVSRFRACPSGTTPAS